MNTIRKNHSNGTFFYMLNVWFYLRNSISFFLKMEQNNRNLFWFSFKFFFLSFVDWQYGIPVFEKKTNFNESFRQKCQHLNMRNESKQNESSGKFDSEFSFHDFLIRFLENWARGHERISVNSFKDSPQQNKSWWSLAQFSSYLSRRLIR